MQLLPIITECIIITTLFGSLVEDVMGDDRLEVTPNEFPFVVDIRLGGWLHTCAGSIVSPQWIVTAANCIRGTAATYTLTAGEHNMNRIEGSEQTRQVVRIVNHPSYRLPSSFENDIALMKVDPPFVFNENVSAVVIPASNFTPTPTATIIGWNDAGGSSASVLMKLDLPFVSDATCNASYGGSVVESMVCYGEFGNDPCQGDSGGPLVCGDNRTLCGISSWGRGCSRPGYLGVNTETSYFSEWITDATTFVAEDPVPVINVTTCGGLVNSSSAAINFMVGEALPPGQRCVWTILGPYDSSRFRLTGSGFVFGDHVFVTKYDIATSMPGQQIELHVGQDYVISGGMVLVTLVVGDQPSAGFSLEFFSSGFREYSSFSNFDILSNNTGSLTYPAGVQYRNGENALFILNPSQAGNRVLTFTSLDVEDNSSAGACVYDAVKIYTWTNDAYSQVARFCGTTPPPSFNVSGGLALITFTTDTIITGNGFTFNWE